MSRRRQLPSDAKALAIACPVCEAKAGERCKTARTDFHAKQRAGRPRAPHAAREYALRARRRKLVELSKAAQADMFAAFDARTVK